MQATLPVEEMPPTFPATPELWAVVLAHYGPDAAAAGRITLVAPAGFSRTPSGPNAEARSGEILKPVSGGRMLEGADLPVEILRELRRQRELLLGLHTQMEAVARNQHELHRENEELRDAKAALAAMHGEGLFAFARHIDREAREQFLAIMASGDIAKAARELDLKDSTLRSKLNLWPKRGKAYAALAEVVRWRKAIKGQAGMEFAKRVASGAERDVDFPALIRDVVSELEELDPENWEERCANLADALKAAVA